jgi:hypothetical protein
MTSGEKGAQSSRWDLLPGLSRNGRLRPHQSDNLTSLRRYFAPQSIEMHA